MAERDLDVVVFGATGVTGRQVAVYLGERASEVGGRWAAAARDAGKLERTFGELGVEGAETIAADLGDAASLAAMAARAKVVLNLVGPYTTYGRPVIEACVENGAHYLDLTGEIPFARLMADEFGARAREAGVKIVEVAGFEALPPDLAVRLAAETARERHGEELAEADLEVSTTPPSGMPRASDLLSGGTMQSMAVLTGAPHASLALDPAALVTDRGFAERVRARSPITLAPRRNSRGAVLAPMSPAAFINPAVIHRSAELAGEQPFRYREGVAIPGPGPTLPLRYAAAGALSATQAGIGALARARPGIRKRASAAMTRVLPSSGFGPAADRLEEWRWSMLVEARTTGGGEVRVEIEAEGQPGYLTTARMIGEAGLLLAEDSATPDGSGFLTPAIALGTASAARFERARLRFAVAK